MSDPTAQEETQAPPPKGDSKKAEKYISQLIQLIEHAKLSVKHTDLARYDPSNLHDHYMMDMGQYLVEVSHSKDPNSGKDSYVIIFNNLKIDAQELPEKILLAYLHLEPNQFIRFKHVADGQLDKRRHEEEEKRLNEALAPVDETLDKMTTSTSDHSNGINYDFPEGKTLSNLN